MWDYSYGDASFLAFVTIGWQRGEVDVQEMPMGML